LSQLERGSAWMEELRYRIHKAFDVAPMAADFPARALASLQRAGHGSGDRWPVHVLSGLAVVLAIVLVGAAALGIHELRLSGERGAVSTGPVLQACSVDKIDLAVSVQRRSGTRFSFLTVTPINRGGPCQLRLPLTVKLADPTGAALNIKGNEASTILQGALPKDHPIVAYSWANWCGTSPAIVETMPSRRQSYPVAPGAAPPCSDSIGEVGTPSVLEPAILLDSPSSARAPLGVASTFSLLAQCGLQVVDFDASYWDLVAGQSIAAINMRGMMTLVNENGARFQSSGTTLYFSRHVGSLIVDPNSLLCD